MSNEKRQPLQMTGTEIQQTFGSRDVLDLETLHEELQNKLAELREKQLNSWEDQDVSDQIQVEIDHAEAELKNTARTLREKRNQYGQTIDSTKV